MIKLKSIAALGFAAALLAGCTGLELGEARKATPTGTAFSMELYKNYLKLAEWEYSEGDYGDSDYFALKAKAAAANQGVAPTSMDERMIPGNAVGALSSARKRLVAALVGGGIDKAPKDAAMAQAMFDCWMQEQEENFQPTHIARCRNAFFDAINKVELALAKKPMAAPAPAPRALQEVFTVYFDFNSSAINRDGSGIIRRIVRRIDRLKPRSVSITGHTDRAGAANYNMSLSQSRADAVAKAISGAAKAKPRLGVGALGENVNAVQTADGVREQWNRRVEVRIIP